MVVDEPVKKYMMWLVGCDSDLNGIVTERCATWLRHEWVSCKQAQKNGEVTVWPASFSDTEGTCEVDLAQVACVAIVSAPEETEVGFNAKE